MLKKIIMIMSIGFFMLCSPQINTITCGECGTYSYAPEWETAYQLYEITISDNGTSHRLIMMDSIIIVSTGIWELVEDSVIVEYDVSEKIIDYDEKINIDCEINKYRLSNDTLYYDADGTELHYIRG